jgi:hypothetical protein
MDRDGDENGDRMGVEHEQGFYFNFFLGGVSFSKPYGITTRD